MVETPIIFHVVLVGMENHIHIILKSQDIQVNLRQGSIDVSNVVVPTIVVELDTLQPIVMIQRYYIFFSKNQIFISLGSGGEIRKSGKVRVKISIIVGKIQTSTEGYVLSCGIIGTIYHIKLDLAFKSFKLKNKKTSVPVRLHIYTSCTPELPAHLLVYISVRSYTCTQQETYTHLHCLFTRTACTTVHIHTYLDIFYSFIVA